LVAGGFDGGSKCLWINASGTSNYDLYISPGMTDYGTAEKLTFWVRGTSTGRPIACIIGGSAAGAANPGFLVKPGVSQMTNQVSFSDGGASFSAWTKMEITLQPAAGVGFGNSSFGGTVNKPMYLRTGGSSIQSVFNMYFDEFRWEGDASVVTPQAPIFISELIEGKASDPFIANDKAIELYNPNSTPFNCYGWNLRLPTTVSTTWPAATSSTNAYSLTNITIPANSAWVLVYVSAGSALKAKANTTVSSGTGVNVFQFTGDRPIGLFNGTGNTPVDVVGSTTFFGDTTLRRVSGFYGNPVYTPSEWTDVGLDISDFGIHTP
jgi:hypothetical protein